MAVVITAAVHLVKLVLMTALTSAVGERLEPFPNKDDLWPLLRRSSPL